MNITLQNLLPMFARNSAVAASTKSLPQQLSCEPIFNLFGIDINNVVMDDAISLICKAAKQYTKINIAFANADCVNKYVSDEHYFNTLNNFDYVFADGVGIRLAAQVNRSRIRDNVNGTDLFPVLCKSLESTNSAVYFFGAGQGVAKEMARKLKKQYPDLAIAGYCDGYSHELDDPKLIDKINAAQPDILFVALGAPTQEKWIAKNAPMLNSKVNIAVGGLFDFYSGRIKRAPEIVRKASLEWAWRLFMEPGKKAKRYLLGNPLFIYRLLAYKLMRRSISLTTYSNSYPSWSRSLGLIKFKLWYLSKYIAPGFKRLFDISVCACLLFLLTPILSFIAILIRLDSQGDIFYKQERVGKFGKRFRMWKFRSMQSNADKIRSKLDQRNEMNTGVTFKMKDDPRITRIGRFLRRTSIDELPQLLNVLLGDMSLVGPRPPLAAEVAQYTPQDRERLAVKPGITCIWQVSGRSDLSFPQQVKLDINYIETQSFFVDLQILLKTIPAVITGKGAY